MEFRYLKSCFLLSAGLLLLSGCQENEPVFEEGNLSFDIHVESVEANDVTVSVQHNGTDDVTFYAFCYKDFSMGETAAIDSKVDELRASGEAPSSFLLKGKELPVTCSGLQSSTRYRFVVFGLDDQFNVYGNPASVYFDTVKGAVIYEENPDWRVSYQGKQATTDYTAYGDVVQVTVSSSENGYFAMAVPYAEYQEKGIQACVEEAVAEKEAMFSQWEEEGYIVNRADYVYYTTAGFIIDMEDDTEYVGIAAGVDENFEPTGLYAVSPSFVPDEAEYSQDFGKWLGEWTISGPSNISPSQTVSYDITIDYFIPDQMFSISGYQSDTGVDMPSFNAGFDPSSGCLVFISSYVQDMYIDNMFSQLYFYGTRTDSGQLTYMGGNYSIANAVLTGDGSATVLALSISQSGGGTFTPTEMQFMAQTSSSWMNFGAVPQFPLTMTKKN